MSKLPGVFGNYGGIYVPDTLYQALIDLDVQYNIIRKDPKFQKELAYYLRDFVGRPTPLTYAAHLSKLLGIQLYLKREDLNHTGAHKINNTVGQALLARRLGKKRLIAETGAGQHGVASATVASLFGMSCTVYMGKKDIERQALNVYRMQLLGATVVPVTGGSQTLKDATTEAIRDWMGTVDTSHYMIGSALGPHPYPTMVRDFQSVIGKEAKKQILQKEGRLPDAVVACVGGGSNSLGIFTPFIKEKSVRLIAVEAAGKGVDTDQHAATLTKGRPGVLHGTYSYLLQDKNGQIQEAHSISAGLDYPGVGPELAHFKDTGRIEAEFVTDTQAINACKWLAANEGIIPALESSHALAYLKEKSRLKKGDLVILCLSGRGDKDMETLRNAG